MYRNLIPFYKGAKKMGTKEKKLNLLTQLFKKNKVSNHENSVNIDNIKNDHASLAMDHEELKLNKNHLEHAQQIAQIGSWEYIIDDDTLSFSSYAHDIFGSEQTDRHLSLNQAFDYVHPDDRDKTYSIVRQAAEKGIGCAADFRIYHGKTGELRYLKGQAEAIWKDNKPYKLIGVVHDDTTQHHLESRMDETKKRNRLILDHLNAGIWLKEYTTGRTEYVSKGASELLQYPVHKLCDDPNIWENLIHPDEREEVLNRQKLLKEGETLHHQYRIQCGDGTLKWVYDQTVPWFNDKGELTYLFGMLADITPEIEMQKRLEYLATHDALTSLPNQRSLYDKLDTLCESDMSEPFALYYLDLDRFQIINDSLGYNIGDEVLKRTANRILSVMPDGAYLARISSNDFIMVV